MKKKVRERWKTHDCGMIMAFEKKPFIWFKKCFMYVEIKGQKMQMTVKYCPICGKKIGNKLDCFDAFMTWIGAEGEWRDPPKWRDTDIGVTAVNDGKDETREYISGMAKPLLNDNEEGEQ